MRGSAGVGLASLQRPPTGPGQSGSLLPPRDGPEPDRGTSGAAGPRAGRGGCAVREEVAARAAGQWEGRSRGGGRGLRLDG